MVELNTIFFTLPSLYSFPVTKHVKRHKLNTAYQIKIKKAKFTRSIKKVFLHSDGRSQVKCVRKSLTGYRQVFGGPYSVRMLRIVHHCTKLLSGEMLNSNWPDQCLSDVEFAFIFLSSSRLMSHLAKNASVSNPALTLCSLRCSHLRKINHKKNRLSSDLVSLVTKITAE